MNGVGSHNAMIRRNTLEELLTELNTTDETEDLEAKQISGSELGKSVFETICALSNEPDLEGGTILLGISKEQSLFNFYSVTGVKDPDKVSSNLASACTSIFNQPIRVGIHAIKYRGATVLKVDVPELPRSHKPLYVDATGLPRGAWRRVGPTDVRGTDDDLAMYYQGGSGDAFDARIIRDASWADIDPAAIQTYRKARAMADPIAEELNWSDEEMLIALSAVRRLDGLLRVTNGGILMFGTTQSIRRIFPAHRVDYIRVPGRKWVQDPGMEFEGIDMRGSIMTLIPRVIAAISDDLPRTFLIDEKKAGQRTETPVLPFRVIREAVVNALMHRSYQFNSPIQVIRYANRVVIKNSGYSLKSEDRFEDPGSSIRNPNIAAILHETRFAETKGSGIRVMRATMNQRGLASPAFESDRSTDEFSASFLFHHFLDQKDLDWLAGFERFNLTEDQMKALVFVREAGAIDNSTYRSLTLTDTLQASASLRALRKVDILANKGSGTRTYYVAGPEMQGHDDPVRPDRSGRRTIHDKEIIMDGGIHDSDKLLMKLPLSARVAVRNAQAKRRLSLSEGREFIELICTHDAFSTHDIAVLMDKTANYVSQRYLGPMTSEKILEYTHPEMIQHPDQKYRKRRKEIGRRGGRRAPSRSDEEEG